MPDPTPALTAKQSEELDQSLADSGCHGFLGDHPDLYAVVARMVAAAEQRGRAEVSAAVEALADEWESWSRTRSTPRIDAFRDAAEQVRAALADPAAAVVRRLTNGCRRCGRPLGDAFDSDDHACPTPTDRIGGESDA